MLFFFIFTYVFECGNIFAGWNNIALVSLVFIIICIN